MEVANGGRLPARIEGIEMSWEDGSGLRDYVRLDEITLHRGGVSQRLNTWEDLQTALRQFSIPPGGRLTVDFQYYFEETGEGGRLLPENARGRMVQTIRFGQEEPGGPGEPGNSGGRGNPGVPNHSLNPDEPDTLQLPVNPGEPSDPPPPPPGEMAQEQPGAAATRPPVIPPGPGLPYTGGNPLAYLGAGVVLATLGILLRCRP